MIVADTSVIYALLDGRDRWHQRTTEWYQRADPEFATTPLVLAEVDHLAAARAGTRALGAWRHDLAVGAYAVEWWATAPADTVEEAARYENLGISLTDASLVRLAARLRTVEVATLDERHFRAMRPLVGSDSFRLLPIDG